MKKLLSFITNNFWLKLLALLLAIAAYHGLRTDSSKILEANEPRHFQF